MKIKIGTLLDENLVQRAKKYAAANNKALNQLIEQSLDRFLQSEASDKVLSLKEILGAEPGSKSSEGSGRGAGSVADFD